MNKLKKIASLVLALVMALALAVPAFAEAGDTTAATAGSITISNATKDATYKAYRIFDLESYSGNAYAYVINADWKDFLKVEGVDKYVKENENGYIEWVNEDDQSDDGYTLKTSAAINEFAKLAMKYATDNKIAAAGSATASADRAVTISNLPLGYYLVDSTVGTVCSLNTTAPNVEIIDKNSKPTVDKVIVENNQDVKKNSTNIGERVNFKTTITAEPGAENYVLHDKMDSGFTFEETVDGQPNVVVQTLNTPGDYTVVTGDATEDDCTFHVVFTKTYLDKITAETRLVVTYSAVLNENAKVIDSGSNDNDSWLKYGADNKNETEKSKTRTYTYSFNLHKYGNTDTETQLAGAKFELRKAANDADTALYFTLGENATYTYSESKQSPATKEIVTVADYDIVLKGLDAGTYYLVETDAPEGYNLLKDPVTVEIREKDDENDPNKLTSELKQGEAVVNAINVQNQSGVELPSTGGIGTTIFYVVGGVLAAGAVILLITKRRMNINK